MPEQRYDRESEVEATMVRVARRVAELRRARGLTQEHVATQLELALKNYQRVERGRQNLTLRTIVNIARVLGVAPEALMVTPRDATVHVGRPRKRSELAAPAALDPLRVAGGHEHGRVPLLSLEAAAGSAGHPSEAGVAGWVELPSRRRFRRGMFVARVVGRSMEPLIPAGAYCLFEAPAAASGAGEVLLVEHGDLRDPDTGASYTIKRVFLGDRRDGKRRRRYARLVSVNPAFPSVEVDLGRHREQRLRVIARFIEVVGG